MATSTLRFRIVGQDDASGAFLAAAASADAAKTSMDNFGSSALSLAKIWGLSLIPTLGAGAVAAVVSLGDALGAAAGATGVFGLSAKGMVTQMVKQQATIAATQKAVDGATKGTTTYKDELKKLHMEQSAFNQTFGPAAKGFEKMHAAYQNFSSLGVTKNVLGKGFDLVAKVLPKLTPVAKAAGHAIGGLIDDLSKWVDGPGFKKLIDFFAGKGSKDITLFGHTIGHLLSGLGGILENFIGPGQKAAHTVERLSASFDKWGHSKGVSDSVQKFLQYVGNNGHNITGSLLALAQAAPKIAVALGQLSSTNLSVTTKALTLIAGLPQGAFNAVADGLFGIYVAAKLLTIFQGMQAMWLGAVAALSKLKDLALITRVQLIAMAVAEKVAAVAAKAWAAAQWLLNAAMDANPIALIVIAIAAAVAAFIYAYKTSDRFRAVVNGALHAVGTAAQWLWRVAIVPAMHGIVAAFDFVKAHWVILASILGGPAVAVAIQLVKHWNEVVGVLRVVGQWARWLWNNAFQPALQMILHGTAAVISIWAHLLSALSHVPGFGWAKDAANALQHAADTANALADGINKIPSHKTSTVDMVINTIHNTIHTTGGNSPLGPATAHGGITTRAGMQLVGENGPELLHMPRGAQVTPLRRADRYGGGGLGDTYVINVHTSGLVDPASMTKQIYTELLKLKRTRGGAAMGLA